MQVLGLGRGTEVSSSISLSGQRVDATGSETHPFPGAKQINYRPSFISAGCSGLQRVAAPAHMRVVLLLGMLVKASMPFAFRRSLQVAGWVRRRPAGQGVMSVTSTSHPSVPTSDDDASEVDRNVAIKRALEDNLVAGVRVNVDPTFREHLR